MYRFQKISHLYIYIYTLIYTIVKTGFDELISHIEKFVTKIIKNDNIYNYLYTK